MIGNQTGGFGGAQRTELDERRMIEVSRDLRCVDQVASMICQSRFES